MFSLQGLSQDETSANRGLLQIPLLQVLCPWDRVVAKRLVGCILECLWVNYLDTVSLGVLLIELAVLVTIHFKGAIMGRCSH